MVKVKSRAASSISVVHMKDGQIGVIVAWNDKVYLDRVVQRVGQMLITLGGMRA